MLFAAEHPKREYWVTEKTARAIVANKIAPGVLDHLLARNGFASQQTDEPHDAGAPDDLFEPVDRLPTTTRRAWAIRPTVDDPQLVGGTRACRSCAGESPVASRYGTSRAWYSCVARPRHEPARGSPAA